MEWLVREKYRCQFFFAGLQNFCILNILYRIPRRYNILVFDCCWSGVLSAFQKNAPALNARLKMVLSTLPPEATATTVLDPDGI